MKNLSRLMKSLLLFGMPFFIIVIIYVMKDPFMIIHNYDDFNSNYFIHKNRDFISSEMYFKNSKKYNYDSFIFGSSTALYTPPSIRCEFIEPKGLIYSFDASGENIVGVWSKIQFLNSFGCKINNALITIDQSIFSTFVNDNPIFMKHYEIYPSSKLKFHYMYFLNFMDIRFLIAWTHYSMSNKFYPYMNKILESQPYHYDTITNEYFNTGILEELKTDSVAYYSKRKDRFPQRNGLYVEADSVIDVNEVSMLNEIKSIFLADSTSFKILICPSYDQIAFNRSDKEILEAIFGSTNVFDFSGINTFTEEKSNFYDALHFKKYVSREFFQIMYQ